MFVGFACQTVMRVGCSWKTKILVVSSDDRTFNRLNNLYSWSIDNCVVSWMALTNTVPQQRVHNCDFSCPHCHLWSSTNIVSYVNCYLAFPTVLRISFFRRWFYAVHSVCDPIIKASMAIKGVNDREKGVLLTNKLPLYKWQVHGIQWVRSSTTES